MNPDFLQYSWHRKNKFVSLVFLLPMYQSILDKHTSLPPTRISAAFWRFPPEVMVIIISNQSPTLQGTNISYLGKRKIIHPQVPAGDGMHQMPIAPGDLPCEAWPTLGRHQWPAFHSRGNGCRLNGLMAWWIVNLKRKHWRVFPMKHSRVGVTKLWRNCETKSIMFPVSVLIFLWETSWGICWTQRWHWYMS